MGTSAGQDSVASSTAASRDTVPKAFRQSRLRKTSFGFLAIAALISHAICMAPPSPPAPYCHGLSVRGRSVATVAVVAPVASLSNASCRRIGLALPAPLSSGVSSA